MPQFVPGRGTVVPIRLSDNNYDEWFRVAAKTHRLDAFHVTSPFDGGPIPTRDSAPCPLVATVYDLLPLRLPFYFNTALDEQRYVSRLEQIAKYHSILTLSKAVRNDLTCTTGISLHKVHVMGAGVDPAFSPLPESLYLPVLRKWGVTDPFILCTGGDDARKNLFRLVEAFAQLSNSTPRVQLVIVCALSQSSRQSLNRLASQLGVLNRLVLTGYVPRDDLIALYNGCRVYAFPSLAEGFGLPLLEAMACGAPVVTSDRPPMTEVCGDAAVYVDPLSTTALAQAIDRLLSDGERRQVMGAKGIRRAAQFRWEDVALTVRQTYLGLNCNSPVACLSGSAHADGAQSPARPSFRSGGLSGLSGRPAARWSWENR